MDGRTAEIAKKRVYIDMDGVLCEYRKDATTEDYESDGYFTGLAPRRDMVSAVEYLISSGEADVFVLSSVIPGRQLQATAEKNDWLNRHLPVIDGDHRIFPLCGTDKAKAVKGIGSGDILFDDYSANLVLWHAAGGKAVKILNEVNGNGGSFKDGPRLKIRNREDLLETVRSL